jgi:hypothetical protein
MSPDQPLIHRRIDQAQAKDAYRVIWNGIEVGSIGLQQGSNQRTFWHWAIDTLVPPPDFAIRGDTISRDDAMVRFRKAWNGLPATRNGCANSSG